MFSSCVGILPPGGTPVSWRLAGSTSYGEERVLADSRISRFTGANTQGAKLDEARENLQEAIQLVLEGNRVLTEEPLNGKEAIRELRPIG
jgi:hypothetical protein